MISAEFIVRPGVLTVLWVVAVLGYLVGAPITAAKGRLGWLAIGVITGGVILPITATMIARPESIWARRFYRPEKMARAHREFGLTEATR